METRLIDSDKCLFILTFEDAQLSAIDLIGRNLTEEELRGVRKGIEWGLGDWSEVMHSAILNAADTKDEDDDQDDDVWNE